MKRSMAVLIVAGLSGPVTAAGLPAPLEVYAAQQTTLCTEQGGIARVGPAFATPVDLNSDGLTDYIVDLAGIECANAWSAFCSEDGCPLSVWITGATGPVREWDGQASGWRIEDTDETVQVAVEQTGEGCDPDPGREVCTQRLSFKAPVMPLLDPVSAPKADDPAAATLAEALPLSAPDETGWTLRAVPGGTPVAVSAAPGSFESLAAFCLGGEPFLAATLDMPLLSDTAEIGFAFSSTTVTAAAQREDGAGGAFVIPLRASPLMDMLAGRDNNVDLSLVGTSEGQMSLRGSTRAIRSALKSCTPG